jgi:hypothetical protein
MNLTDPSSKLISDYVTKQVTTDTRNFKSPHFLSHYHELNLDFNNGKPIHSWKLNNSLLNHYCSKAKRDHILAN